MGDFYIFSEVTRTNKAGVVYVGSILSLLFTVLTLITRFQIKYHTLGNDDWAILAATVVALGQYIAIFVSLENGLGVSTTVLSGESAQHLGIGLQASAILYLLSVALSKLSVVLFIQRLLTQDLRGAWWASNIAMGVTAAWGIASACIISIGCGSGSVLDDPATCVGENIRWAVVIGTDGFLELSYIALVIALVTPLQMSVYTKCSVVFAFAFRLPCIVFAALHGVSISRFLSAADHGTSAAYPLLWQQIALGYAVIASTIPTLKSFIRGYNKALGRDASYKKRRLGGGYGLDSYGAGQSGGDSVFQLRSLGRRPPATVEEDEVDMIKLRPEESQYHAGAYRDKNGRGKEVRRMTSTASNESEDPIIRRDVSVRIEYEGSH